MIAGVIAEFNPFHNGHKYLLQEAKKGADGLAVVMSPNVCQRGEFSLYNKFIRAEAAVRCGADLVVEMPSISAAAAAEDFARVGVKILTCLGMEKLVFGSEGGNKEALFRALENLEKAEKSGELKEKLKSGESYPKVLGSVLGEAFNDAPNDILALEYIKNLNSIPFETVKRVGVSHNSNKAEMGFASGSYIRKNGIDKGLIPSEAYDLFIKEKPFDYETSEVLELSYLKRLTAAEIALAPGVSEGIQNRIYEALKEANSLEEALELIKTKRYSLARIRRILFSLYLGFKKEDDKEPKYIRILAFNDKGKEIIKAAKKTSPLPIITSLSEALKISEEAKVSAEREGFITDIYNFNSGIRAGEDFRFSPKPVNISK